jgi:curved DNA-binding protein CbpA
MASGQVVSVNPMGQTTAPVQPPSAALVQLLSPDGYYTYLNVQRATEGVELDEEQIKKNYRKLSLKHHPDRPTGDAHCFRVLNRAQKVLLHPKLRQQYDLLGIDLEEDDEDKPDNEEEGDTIPASEPSSSSSSSAESIISHMASATLATILQVIVRTGAFFLYSYLDLVLLL